MNDCFLKVGRAVPARRSSMEVVCHPWPFRLRISQANGRLGDATLPREVQA